MIGTTGWSGYVRYRHEAMIRYRLEFVGVAPLPLPDHVDREQLIVIGTVELYQAQRFLVESVDENTDPPVAVLRKVQTSFGRDARAGDRPSPLRPLPTSF